jgi:SMC interacting uncharacterized protein involved in chromosome segregation
MTETRPSKIVINCQTGERQILFLSDEEIAEREAMAQQAEAERLEREAEEQRIADLKASAKSKLIAGEALSADEASVIVL